MTKRRSLIVTLALCAAMFLSVACISAIRTKADGTTPGTDESGTYLIGTADELFAFAELANTAAETETSSARTVFKGKLTADINLNPGVSFNYDHKTGFVTVSKGDVSYKAGTGMKNTEIGNFHPVYNGICTKEEWEDEDTTDEQKAEWVAEMQEKIEALGLRKWTPIGARYKQYIGYFDGDGHTIDGLYINDETIGYAGLFGVIGNYSYIPGDYDYGEVKNVTIGSHSLIVGRKSGSGTSVGAIVGMTEFAKISDCTNYATVIGIGTINFSSAYGLVGGIVGYANNEVKNCVNRGTVVSCYSAGGVVGNVMGNSSEQGHILNCSNYGDVYAQSDMYPFGFASGIAVNSGQYNSSAGYGGTIEGCVNYGYVEGWYTAGILSNGAKTNVKYCANRGDVCATDIVGGIVRYIGRDGFTLEGCYNAGTVRLLTCDAETEMNFSKICYPIAAQIFTYSTDGAATSHNVKNCYNDESVCPAENGLVGEKINATNCYGVTSEVFATGEPAYKMGSNNKSGWRQNLPEPAEDGKSAETYPTIDGTRRVYFTTHYCCHTDSANKEAHKTSSYTNAYGDITDEHTPNENGICSHCGKNMRLPSFSADVTPPSDKLPEGKVGEYYNVIIRVNDDAPRLNDNIEAVVSETDDTSFSFTNGLTGESAYNYRNGYYYSIYGIPTEAGTVSFTLSATNENGTTKKTFTLKIGEGDPLEIVSDSKLDNATAGEYYSTGYFMATTSFSKTWALAEDSELPDGLELTKNSYSDYQVVGTPTTAGEYSFTMVVSAGGQTAQKTFTLLVLPEGGCKHESMTKVDGIPESCYDDGIADYYHCLICGENFADSEGKTRVDINNLRTASKHVDKNLDGKCDFCKKNMPVFKRQISDGGVVYGGTYILVTIIGGKYYALSVPPISEYGREYDEFMTLSEITPDANGDFAFTALEDKGALMLKTEFAVADTSLDAKIKRYGLSSIIGNVRYGLSDGGPDFYMYPNELAKYGYRISINDRGEAKIGSVYQEWWSNPETAENGLLRAFDMNFNDKNYKFMSFSAESDYNGKYGDYVGAEMTEYPIYLYRMTNVGKTSNGVTFVTNDSGSNVGKGDLDLPDIIDLSDVSGIAEAVSEDYIKALVEEKAAGSTDVIAEVSAEISATELEKDGETLVSVKYSVTPKVAITDRSGNVLYEGDISDDDLSGMPITVTLYAGRVIPAQIIHYKSDGSKEYFYPERSEQALNGAKTFAYDYDGGFVTFRIDSFSDIEILATAKEEEAGHVHDYGALIAEVKATCSASGKKAHYVCKGCGKTFDENKVEVTEAELIIEIDKNAHKFGEWIAEIPATTETTGTKGHKDCELCHKHFDNDGAEISDLTIEKLPKGDEPSESGSTSESEKDSGKESTDNSEKESGNSSGSVTPSKKGCGSSLGSSLAVSGIGALAIFAFMFFKKKSSEE